MPRRTCREEPRAGTLDMLSARSSSVRKRLGDNEKVSIEYIEASGDCFYLAMESALSEGEGWCPYYAVATMRDVVASSMTEEVYQMYDLMHREQANGARACRLCGRRRSCWRRALRRRTHRCGRLQVHERRRLSRLAAQAHPAARLQGVCATTCALRRT
jgi:hypothetical protein